MVNFFEYFCEKTFPRWGTRMWDEMDEGGCGEVVFLVLLYGLHERYKRVRV